MHERDGDISERFNLGAESSGCATAHLSLTEPRHKRLLNKEVWNPLLSAGVFFLLSPLPEMFINRKEFKNNSICRR